MIHSRLTSGICAFAIALACAMPTPAQVATGTPPFGSFSGGPDTVNNANLNDHIAIPVVVKGGRGLTFSYALSFDSSVWYPSGGVWVPVSNWGWHGMTGALTGYTTYSVQQNQCWYPPGPSGKYYIWHFWYSFQYHDAAGVEHDLPGWVTDWQALNTPCGSGGGFPSSLTGTATDGSGYAYELIYGPWVNLWATGGTSIQAPLLVNSGNGSLTDRNSNTITGSVSSGTTTFLDTLGMTALQISGSGTPSSPYQFQYTGASGAANVYMNFQSYTVETNFGCSSPAVTDYGRSTQMTQNLVSSITFPDGTSYSFGYESTVQPNHANAVTGRIASITLPTGGEITYDYGNTSQHNSINCSDGSAASLKRTTPDGQWTYTRGTGSPASTTIQDPPGNQTVIDFQGIYETERQVYQGASTLLETVNTCYNGASIPCTSTAVVLPIANRAVQATLPGVSPSQTYTTYNAYGLTTETDKYNYGPSLVRKTITSYTGCGVTNPNVVNRPCSVTIENASGGAVASTTYSYDANGNLLTESHSTGGTPATVSRTFTYGSYGVLTSATDFNSNATSYSNFTCGNNTAFPQTISSGGLTTQQTWNCNGGLKSSTTDPNSNTTSFSYDNMNRLIQTSYPDGGVSKTQYTSATVHDFCTLILGSVTSFCTPGSGSLARHDETVLDGLARTIHEDLVSDPSGETYVDTTYDSLGRLYTRSNPYRSTSDPTYGKDTNSYDALNRVTKVTHADGNYSQVSYGSGTQSCSASTYGYGYPALYTDESTNQRRTFADGLGRVVEVDEPDPTNGNSLTLNTCYAYDAQGNLTSVVQGNETRAYSYDGLSRLTQQTTPEGATTYYYYATSGGSLCANNQKLVCRKTDARGITTTYSYDALDRLTGKSYSNGDASVSYYYDLTSYNGLTITNGKGQRTGMSDGSGQTAWSYDKMGRIVAEERTIGTVTKTISYSYNLDGSLASITYPSGRVVSYSYGNDARPVAAVDSANSINYAKSATYAPPGGLASLVSGHSGSFSGITTSNSYNNRLFPTALSASSSNGTALSLSYTYFANGNVNVETNGRDNGRSATYTYDALNRVSTAKSQATSGSDCWGQSFAYDRYANLTTISSTQCSAPILSLSVNTNNRITNSGFSYDAAGDLTGDGVNSYSWNGEAHLKTAASVTYTYDGGLRRVKKSNGTLYWYCATCGNVLAESDLSGNIISEYALFNGRRIARRDVASGNVYYIFHDRLGSYRTLTDSTGNVKGESDYYPFGAERVVSSTVADNFRFAGMEWDSEDGLNHTLYRQYTSAQGRWETPDRKRGWVMFAGMEWGSEDGLNHTLHRQYTSAQGRWETTDPKRGCVNFPQGQNLYAYVKDDPTNLIDLLGDDPISGENPCGGTGWESNAACSAPGDSGGGGAGGGGGGGGGAGGGAGSGGDRFCLMCKAACDQTYAATLGWCAMAALLPGGGVMFAICVLTATQGYNGCNSQCDTGPCGNPPTLPQLQSTVRLLKNVPIRGAYRPRWTPEGGPAGQGPA